MNVKQKQISLIKHPFSDFKGGKVRPVLIISNDNLNKKSEDCVAVPLTANIKDEPYSVIISQRDLQSGDLIKTSRIRIDKILSINKKLIVLNIGFLNDDSFNKVKKEFLKLI